jgi:hypothetical protein
LLLLLLLPPPPPIIIIQFNSVQFNRYLLTCRLHSTSAYYKAYTKINKTKTVQIHKNKTLKKQNKNKYEENQYKRSTGAEILYPDRT